jgi:hypothetical protein
MVDGKYRNRKIEPNFKFLNRIEVPGLGKVIDKHKASFSEEKISNFKAENVDNFYAALFGNDEVIFCSKLQINGKDLWIPEPNPVHIYFYNAFRLVPKLIKSQIEFELMADQLNGSSTIETYPYLLKFISNASQFVFNAFSSIEAFINQCIPEQISYKSKKKGVMNKEEVERHLYFKEKSTRLMKSIYSKSILDEESVTYSEIWKLKELRDNLIHLKTKNDKYRNKYREVMNELLNFEYNKSIAEVENYINYFELDFIEHNEKADI